MSLIQRIQDHIGQQYLGGDAAELTADTALLELNIVDSASIFDIVRFLGQQEGVEVPIECVNAENFSTIRAMAALLDKLKAR